MVGVVQECESLYTTIVRWNLGFAAIPRDAQGARALLKGATSDQPV